MVELQQKMHGTVSLIPVGRKTNYSQLLFRCASILSNRLDKSFLSEAGSEMMFWTTHGDNKKG
jgi:hypothetical protein